MKNKKQIQKVDVEGNESDTDSGQSESSEYDSVLENGTSEDSNDDYDIQASEKDIQSEDKKHLSSESGDKINKIKRKRDDNSNSATDNGISKKFKSTKHLYKPPTVEEMNQLRETENLFHSNLFRMQINEMLKEIKIKDKYKNFVKEWLKKFNEFLKNLNSSNEKEESPNLSWLKRSQIIIPIDISNISNNKSFYFQFLKPENESFVIGSFQTDTIIGPLITVDVCVSMPSKCFQKDDYLNLIYDKKRALYLAYLAWKMRDDNNISKFHSEMKFNYYKNNPYKPILEIKPENKIGNKLNFRIFICSEEKTFKLNRFVPWNSNIRGSLFGEEQDNSDYEKLLATPNYNATVLCDLTMKKNHEFLEKLLNEHKNLREGLILLKIWLKQRNFDSGYCSFGSFIMSMLVAYLFKIKKLHASMSSYQIARNTWNYLASSAWNEDGQGISLCDDYSIPNQPTLEQFHVYYDIVFVDTTGFLNICANLSLDLYFKIKYEAKRAIELLNNKIVNSFHHLFMTKIQNFTSFDYILKIFNKKLIENIVKNHCEDKYNFAGAWYPIVLKNITSILRKGLSNRIISMVPIEISSESWSLEEMPKQLKKCFYLGFILNQENAFEILNKGPQANDDKAAEEFRKFWGKKSKLRRFQDGSIIEACVWASQNDILSQKRNIVQRIISYLLNHHFDINYKEIHYFGEEFNLVNELNRKFYMYNGKNKLIDAESTTLKVIRSFDELSKNLRDLNELPLDVSSVQGISEVFRYCDPIPTLNNAKTYLEGDRIIFQSYKIIDAIIQLGFSGKWPDELAAFRRVKTAFHIQIAGELRKKYDYKTRGSIDGVYILKDGYVFRIEIAHQKELTLTKKQIIDKGIVSQYIETPISLQLDKRFNIIPKITSLLHGLYQRYTSYGPAVMISKRWLYSQMIDSYLWPNECTELLMASIYLNLNIYENSFQPQIGFFRFLNLLANTDWKNEMFLLNFNDELTQEEISEIESRFNNERDNFPPLTIITSYDTKKDSIFSKNAPIVQILAHVTILAKHALKIIETKYLQSLNIDINDLFTPNLDGYDAIIYLRSNHVHQCLVENDFNVTKINKATQKRIDATVPTAGFNPVEIGLSELRKAYSDFAVFFYNPCDGKKICIIWKPDIFDEKDFKVTSIDGCQVTENGKIKCNREQLLEDFKIILRDLYYSIEDRKSETYKPKEKKIQVKNDKVKKRNILLIKKPKKITKFKKNLNVSKISKFEKNKSANFVKHKIQNSNFVKIKKK